MTGNLETTSQHILKHEIFKKICSFFQLYMNRIRYIFSKDHYFKFYETQPSSVFDYHNPERIKRITRLRLCLSHFNKHKSKHCFKIVLILFAPANTKLKQLLTTYFTVASTQANESS